MTSPPATGSFEIHSAVNITWLRLSGSNLHCFALREIDETIFKKLQRTQSDLEDAANDPQYLAQKLGDSTNVSLRHACSCLNIPLYPATHEEIVELKRAEAIGCRAPCASLILGSHLVHVLQAFGRRHFSRVIRAQLESLGDASLDPQHNGTIPGRNASDHPKKKKSDEDLPPRKASAATAKRSNANATAAANAAAAAAANANNPPIAIASNPYGTTSRRGQSNPAAGVNQSALDQLQIIPPSQSTSQNNMKNKDPNSTLGYYDDSVPGPKNKKSRHSNTQSVSYYDQNGNYQIDPYVLNQMDAANQFVQLQQTHPGSFPHNQLLYSHQLSSQPNQHSQSYNDPNPHLSHSHTPGSTINSIQTQGHPGLFPPNSQLRVSLHDDHHDDHNHHISQHLNPHSNLLHQANVLLPSSSTALAPSLTNHHSVPGLFPHRPQSAVASARDNAITQQLLTTPSNKTPSLNNDRSNAFGTNSDHQPHNTNLSHALGQLQHHYNANSLLHQPQHHHQPAFTLKDSFHVTPGKNQSQHTRPISAAPFSSHPGATSQSIHNNNNLPQSATNQHNQSTSSITSSQSLSSSSNLNTSNNINTNTNTNTTNTNQHLTTTLQQTFSALPHQLHTIHSSHPSHDGQTSAYQNNSLPTLQRAPTGPLALIRNNSNISSTNMPASLIATTIASNPLHHQPSSKDLSHATIPSIASIANLPVQSLTNQANQSTGTAGAANLGSIANMPGFGNPLNRNQYTTVLQHTNSIGFMTNHPQSNLDSLITSLPSTSSALTIAGRPFSGNAMQSYQPFGVTRPTSAFYPQNQHQQPFQLAQQPFQITADIVGFSVQKKGPIPTISFMVADDGPAPTPVTSNSLPTSSDDHNVSPANEPLPNASATEDDNDGSEIQELVTTQPIPQVTE